jgi:uncharacterized protein YjbI with pentapeptide repeats
MSVHTIESQETYSGDVFKRVDLKKHNITMSHFSECKFIGCDFSDASLQSCRFIDCEFQDCAMKMTKVENTTFARVSFSKCNLLGVNWTEANWSEWATKLSAIEYRNCDLKYGVFFGLELKKIVIKDCNAREVNFAETDLTEGDFSGTDFAGAIFLRTNLTKANFVGAKNYVLNINDNKTKETKFSLPEAIRLLYNMDIVIIDPETNEEMDEETFNDFIG